MKTLIQVTLQSLFLFTAFAETRPDFIPSTPPVAKLITNYTVADVMGIISTEIDQLPANHPYVVGEKYDDALKANWPGAKVATNIDAIIQIVLDAPPISDPELPIARQIAGAWGNVEVFIYNIMDVPDASKVEALLRTVNAQTDSSKKIDATNFARRQFANLLDPRLLALELPALDNATVYTERYKISEESPRRKLEVRREAKSLILNELSAVMEIDETPFEVANEGAACDALKAWWAQNLPLITTKCAEKKSDPNWKRHPVYGKPWDVKW